jgi:hypothetical protein
MDDGIDSIERAADLSPISHVADQNLDLRVEIGRKPTPLAMNLRIEIVEDANRVSLAYQLIGDMRADESGPSGNQNVQDMASSEMQLLLPITTLPGCHGSEKFRVPLELHGGFCFFIRTVRRMAAFFPVAAFFAMEL